HHEFSLSTGVEMTAPSPVPLEFERCEGQSDDSRLSVEDSAMIANGPARFSS
ncbi:hypothetical protein U1Q18_015309, partial [Sarracenia purpurea var. burkii]